MDGKPVQRPPIRWVCGCSCTIAPRRGRRSGPVTWITTCDPDGPCDQALTGIGADADDGPPPFADVAPEEPLEEPPETALQHALSTPGLRWHKRRPPPEPEADDAPPPPPAPRVPAPARTCASCGDALPRSSIATRCRPCYLAAVGLPADVRRARKAAHRRATLSTGCKQCGGALITDNPAKRRSAGRLCEPCFDSQTAARMSARRDAARA